MNDAKCQRCYGREGRVAGLGGRIGTLRQGSTSLMCRHISLVYVVIFYYSGMKVIPMGQGIGVFWHVYRKVIIGGQKRKWTGFLFSFVTCFLFYFSWGSRVI